MRVALLIAFYALLAFVAWLFAGNQLPPCIGRVPDGRISQECVDHWLATRSPIESVFANPWTAVIFFLVASALTIWWSRRRPARRSEP
jgi:hypothetical protein